MRARKRYATPKRSFGSVPFDASNVTASPVTTRRRLVGHVFRHLSLHAAGGIGSRPQRASGPWRHQAPASPLEQRLVQEVIVRIRSVACRTGRRRALDVPFVLGKFHRIGRADEPVGAAPLAQRSPPIGRASRNRQHIHAVAAQDVFGEQHDVLRGVRSAVDRRHSSAPRPPRSEQSPAHVRDVKRRDRPTGVPPPAACRRSCRSPAPADPGARLFATRFCADRRKLTVLSAPPSGST